MQKPLIAGIVTAVGAATALFAITGPAAAAAAPRQVLYIGGWGTGLASVIDPQTGKDLNTLGDNRTYGGRGRMAFDPGRGLAYIADTNMGVDVVDVAQSRIVKSIDLQGNPESVALTPDGARLYAMNGSNNRVDVLDTTNYSVLKSITVGRSPEDIALSPDGKRAYVVASELYMNDHGNMSVIDTATNTVTATVQLGAQPQALTVTPDGKRAYVANFQDNDVSVVDLTTNTVTGRIPVGAGPLDVQASPDGSRIYVSNSSGNSLSVIDTATNTVATTVAVNGHAYGLVIAPDGTRAFILADTSTGTSAGTGQLVPFDLATNATGTPVGTPRVPANALLIDIAAPGEPTADFSFTPQTGNSFSFDPGAVRSGLVRIVSSTLDTGDGGQSTMTSAPYGFTYTYRTPGTYTVSLTVVDAEGRSATVRKQVEATSQERTVALLALSNLRYVSADGAGSKPLVPNRTAAGAWEKLHVYDLGGGDVALYATVNNRYVTVDPATSKLVASAENAVPFQIVKGADGAFGLRYKATGKFVSTNFDRELTADRDSIGPWEQFVAAINTDVTWSSAVKGYVSADGAGTKPLIANRTAVGSWETFDLIDAGNSQVAFFSHANYRFVTADSGGNAPLIANRTTVGAWEKFTLINLGWRSALLANANGKYVTAENGGNAPLIANRTTVGDWEGFTGLPY
ncbi:PKD domain-containing protein [Dactylosporangium sp. CS-047395]|uniref:PKD domain-containing protein n=1 Tax=Dactylosporangium sp. CS-047395 TaxID=3239936 RepID=UPI003D9229BA